MSVAANEIPLQPVGKGLASLLVIVTVALGWVLVPFYGAVLWACIIALLFAPLHRRLLGRWRGEANASALVTLLIVVVMLIIPMALILAALARDAAALYQKLESGELQPVPYLHAVFDALPSWLANLLDRFGLGQFEVVHRRAADLLAQGSQFIAAQTLDIGMVTLDYIASLFITLYLAFFMLRDGEQLAREIRHAIPLAAGNKHQLFNKFATVVRATVKGNLVIAVIQGALGGVAFWVLGVSGALLWAVVMAFLSLLPAVGAALVWVPVALYYFVIGEVWHGVGLTAFGVLVIGLVDNVLRPALVGKDTRLPDYLVMVTTLGGMVVFGVHGFVLGPAIAALFVAAWHIHTQAQEAHVEQVEHLQQVIDDNTQVDDKGTNAASETNSAKTTKAANDATNSSGAASALSAAAVSSYTDKSGLLMAAENQDFYI